ncbi:MULTISPECIES: DUF1761 family protein [Agromyces]|jgi:hypothetical protein|uniref:DUF1761 domain-containing protein n=1 Tax=Agromyces mediolanus TaxID=41986 RepID=A0A918CCE9_AGRME|nr:MULTISPECIES: DUF1761 family protein [Agromyces]GGR17143.1 hypothetical protein GCM10010196_07390 [Agromyces mediolanus]GLJ71649.1 hypothetical protein GCM10017583_09050 [Agromyces mediolanus]GLU88028.1 hypothetical protein Agsp01_02830 [Agromyces sp. NBRC 114283]
MALLGVALATIVSFVASAVLYATPPVARLIAANSTPRPGIPAVVQMLLVVLRSLLVSLLVLGLMVAADWHGAGPGALLGLALAVLPAVLLLGSVVHENTPVAVAAVHFTDWLAKLVIIGALVGAFL